MDTSSSVDQLPDEVIELILSKCPIKSVAKFKSVSKSWQSIISDPRFCRIHCIQQSKLPENQNMFLFWMKNYSNSSLTYPIIYMILEDGIVLQRDYPKYRPSRGFTPLSSCDGLILLRNNRLEKEEMYMLWNPLIEKHIIIPAFTSKSHPEAFNYLWLHRLYFDSITNDYKILAGYKNWYTLYSCQNGTWGEIKDNPVELDVYFDTTCVDGCIYLKESNGEIMCFDTRDGKLHKFPQPNDVELEGFVLRDISGRVCLVKRSGQYGRRLHLWVMEKNGSFEKSWKKLISMEKEEPDLWHLNVVCLTNEDDVLLSSNCSTHKYNPRENSFQKIEFPGHLVYDDYSFSYSENLYMPPSNTLCSSGVYFSVNYRIYLLRFC